MDIALRLGTFGFHRYIYKDMIDMREVSSYPKMCFISGDSALYGYLVISSKLFRAGSIGNCVM